MADLQRKNIKSCLGQMTSSSDVDFVRDQPIGVSIEISSAEHLVGSTCDVDLIVTVFSTSRAAAYALAVVVVEVLESRFYVDYTGEGTQNNQGTQWPYVGLSARGVADVADR